MLSAFSQSDRGKNLNLNTTQISRDVVLEPADNSRLANLCGQFDEHLRQIERRLNVEIASRGNRFRVTGKPGAAEIGSDVIRSLFKMTDNERLDPERVHVCLQESVMNESDPDNVAVPDESGDGDVLAIQTRKKLVRARGKNQKAYLQNIRDHDLAFGIGPAGTGKTYLAVASAIDALENEQVRRIILVRPAVEAGERLGFLPGDMSQKVDPYLRPMYDALFDMLGPDQVKMFLTRIGFGSRAVVTGDITQIDLPAGQMSGLKNAIDILSEVDGVAFAYFTPGDVVRHQLVQRIVEAYEADNKGGSD